jgi:hypothetical protein
LRGGFGRRRFVLFRRLNRETCDCNSRKQPTKSNGQVTTLHSPNARLQVLKPDARRPGGI